MDKVKAIKFVPIPTQFVSMDRVPEGYYPVSAFAKGNEVVIEINTIPEDIDIHSCDWEGCGSFNHVVRFNVAEKYNILTEQLGECPDKQCHYFDDGCTHPEGRHTECDKPAPPSEEGE